MDLEGYGAKEKESKKGEAARFEHLEAKEVDEEPRANTMGRKNLG